MCTENLVRFDLATESQLSTTMVTMIFFLLNLGASIFKPKSQLEAENAALRQQVTVPCPGNEAPRYVIRDRDGIDGAAVTRRLRAMGIRDKPISPGSPWQNGYVERLIGTIRPECLDHMIVFGEAHLRRILKEGCGLL